MPSTPIIQLHRFKIFRRRLLMNVNWLLRVRLAGKSSQLQRTGIFAVTSSKRTCSSCCFCPEGREQPRKPLAELAIDWGASGNGNFAATSASSLPLWVIERYSRWAVKIKRCWLVLLYSRSLAHSDLKLLLCQKRKYERTFLPFQFNLKFVCWTLYLPFRQLQDNVRFISVKSNFHLVYKMPFFPVLLNKSSAAI